ncbi:S-adenosylmethionine decarboxylase [Ramlibacter tataouinensis]|uniref:S-adenosylmethionine decarboxylase n=1 Tax=Ramlibacter tataouinensis TaxID=94132 RepID=UPI0022F3F27A|nr:S-adenosylmethionine decarboxylase [Ramlibacter tataouinensis]WBY00083.1 S-adenosylmethionine decarboxylase [Ramlibacter tataouinensis]
MRGLHLTADLYQCRCEARWLTEPRQLGQWSRQAAEAVGLAVEHELSCAGPGGGASAALLLPGSHVLLHTSPGDRGVLVDVCLTHAQDDLAVRARELMQALVQRFQPEWTEQRSLDRGESA